MLQSIRDKVTGWVAALFLGAIAIVFVFWGVQMGGSSDVRYAAKVNGQGIGLEEVRRVWQLQEQQLQERMRMQLPPQLAKAQQDALLTRYIQIELLRQQYDKQGYRLSEKALQEAITSNPRWQVDGKFIYEQYAFEARQMGMTTAQYDNEIRKEQQIGQLVGGITSSSFVLPSELARSYALREEVRDVEYAVLPSTAFLADAKIDDAQIQSWYDAHAAEYMTQETVDLEYIELTLASVEGDVPTDEASLRSYYEQIKDQFATVERRRGRQILISVASPDADAAAKNAAEDVLAKAKAGEDFATLAKKYSQDPVSAKEGGDMGWKTSEELDGPFKPLRDALFGMDKGAVSGPIKTDFGYYILRLDDIEGGTVKPFEEVRATVEEDYRRDKAQGLFYDRSQKLGDEAFKALTELGTVSTAVGLPLQKLAGFTRHGGGEFGGNQKVIDAAFAPEALDKGENSPLIAVTDDRAVVLRVAAHHPATQLPLTAVRTQIESQLRETAARDAATKRGAELVERLNKSESWSAVLSEVKLKSDGHHAITRNDGNTPPAIRDAVFAVHRDAVKADKPVYLGVEEVGGYALIAVSGVQPGRLIPNSPEGMSALRAATTEESNAELLAYIQALQQHAKIERNPKVFE